MDDETEYYVTEETDDTEPRMSEETSSRARRIRSAVSDVLLALVAGYCLGWAIAVLVAHFGTGSAP